MTLCLRPGAAASLFMGGLSGCVAEGYVLEGVEGKGDPSPVPILRKVFETKTMASDFVELGPVKRKPGAVAGPSLSLN